jgi:hypothetical protein
VLVRAKLLAASGLRYKLSAPSAVGLVGLVHLIAPGPVITRVTARLFDDGNALEGYEQARRNNGRCGPEYSSKTILFLSNSISIPPSKNNKHPCPTKQRGASLYDIGIGIFARA